MDDERTPLLRSSVEADGDAHDATEDRHRQFCSLIGVVPSNLSSQDREHYPKPGSHTLYERAKRKRRSTQVTSAATTALSNTLLLSQVVLGAALTALGASASSHVLIAVFGAANTVIAGLIAYLKSRGQPMRSRMFKDDLERVVEEIENSEIMWLGIARKMHGYDDIDTDDDVSVRSEVARLTRLYDRALRNNTLNNPDAYVNGQNGGEAYPSLKTRPGQPPAPTVTTAALPSGPQGAPAAPASPVAPIAPIASVAADGSPAASAAAPENGSAGADAAKESGTVSPGPKSSPTAVPDSQKAASASSGDPVGKGPSPSTGKEEPAVSVATAAVTSPSPVPTAAPAGEPPAGVPLGVDIDEGPVTAPPKK